MWLRVLSPLMMKKQASFYILRGTFHNTGSWRSLPQFKDEYYREKSCSEWIFFSFQGILCEQLIPSEAHLLAWNIQWSLFIRWRSVIHLHGFSLWSISHDASRYEEGCGRLQTRGFEQAPVFFLNLGLLPVSLVHLHDVPIFGYATSASLILWRWLNCKIFERYKTRCLI